MGGWPDLVKRGLRMARDLRPSTAWTLDFIPFVQNKFLRLHRGIGQPECHDAHPLALLDPVGCSAVDDDVPGPGWSRLDVGFQPVAGGDRGNEALFARPQPRRFNQIRRDFNAAFVFHIGRCDHRPVEFRLEDLVKHRAETTAAPPPRQAKAPDFPHYPPLRPARLPPFRFPISDPRTPSSDFRPPIPGLTFSLFSFLTPRLSHSLPATNAPMKIVVAYSGGLDTSVLLKWLKEKYSAEIIAYCADVGQADELDGLEEKALTTGASKYFLGDLKEEFARDYIFPMIQAGAIYEGRYLLGTSIARPCITKGMLDVALAEGADAIAHGATGKGNDQVRFELSCASLAPQIKCIAPWRDASFRKQFPGRAEMIAYAESHDSTLN